MTIGTVTGQSVAKNPPGTADVRLLQVRLSNDSDIQTVQWYPLPGDDSPPMNGDKVAVLEIGSPFKIAVGVEDVLVPDALPGERKFFSRDANGNKAALLNLLRNGDIELNGNANTAVRFAALDTQLQLFVAAVNTALAGKLDGSGAAGTLSLDISTAESVTVKLL